MTGSGTQLDPYIIETWSDFITAAGTASAYAEFKKNLVLTSDTSVDPDKLYVDSNGDVKTNVQVGDLPELYENTIEFDLNEIHPEAYTTTITVSCTSLKGNGATIKNISFSNCSGFTLAADSIINGLAIKNFSLFANTVSGYLIDADANDATISVLNYCMASGRIEGQGGYSAAFIRTNYGQGISCGFNIDLNGTSYLRSNAQNRTGFDMYYCKLQLSGAAPANAVKVLTRDCYITGSITGTIEAAIGSRYSVYDIECDSMDGNTLTGVLANSDKCDNIISGIVMPLTPVTTEQLHDAAYLASIGFPIEI